MGDRSDDPADDLEDHGSGDEESEPGDETLPPLEDDVGAGFDSVFVFRAQQPFEDWVRQQVEPDDPGWTFSEIDRCRALLVPELPRMVDADEWLRQNHESVFQRLLRPWQEDPAKWPADRSLEALREWFEVLFSPTIEEMTERPLEREVTCPPVSLRRVREEFLRLSGNGSLWVDVDTGEILAWTDDELEAIREGTTEGLDVSADDVEALQRAFESGALVEVLHRREVRDRSMMLEFAKLVEPAAVSRRLVSLVQGKKARRRFGEAIDAAGLRDRWSEWLEDRIEDELANALDERGVPFVEDVYEDESGERQS